MIHKCYENTLISLIRQQYIHTINKYINQFNSSTLRTPNYFYRNHGNQEHIVKIIRSWKSLNRHNKQTDDMRDMRNTIIHCHLHPLQAANCCRNSRFVVDDDDLKLFKNLKKIAIYWSTSFMGIVLLKPQVVGKSSLFSGM